MKKRVIKTKREDIGMVNQFKKYFLTKERGKGNENKKDVRIERKDQKEREIGMAEFMRCLRFVCDREKNRN